MGRCIAAVKAETYRRRVPNARKERRGRKEEAGWVPTSKGEGKASWPRKEGKESE